MEKEKIILAAMLAKCDAAFLPVRDTQSRRWQVANERRQLHFEVGMRWVTSHIFPDAEKNKATSKAVNRVLEKLDTKKFISLRYPKGTKTLHAKLTEKGDDHTRELCGLPTFQNSMKALKDLKRLSNRKTAKPRHDGLWVAECDFVDGRGWGDGDSGLLAAVLEFMLPLLVRGLAVANANALRHVYYSLTDAGRDLAAKRRKIKPYTSTIDKPGYDPKAWREYDRRVKLELGAMNSAALNTPREIGPIPLPVSWPAAADLAAV